MNDRHAQSDGHLQAQYQMKTLHLLALLILSMSLFSCEILEDLEDVEDAKLTQELCGEITENTVLTDRGEGVDYTITCDLGISANVILDIEAGVVIEVENGLGIKISNQGAIRAMGTAENPVIFRGQNNAGLASWKGILSNTSNPNNSFDFVQIEDGGTGGLCCKGDRPIAALVADEGLISVNNCTFSNSANHGMAIWTLFNKSAQVISFSNNTFRDNGAYGLYVWAQTLDDYSENIMSCTFADNKEPYIGLAMNQYDEMGDATWYKAPIPFLVENALKLGNKGLTLKEGIELVFAPNTEIRQVSHSSNAYLTIEGTAEQPVIMRGQSNIAGAWNGLYYRTEHINNRIAHLQISDAKRPSTDSAIFMDSLFGRSLNLTITNSTIANTDCGIFLGGGIIDLVSSDMTYDNVASETCE